MATQIGELSLSAMAAKIRELSPSISHKSKEKSEIATNRRRIPEKEELYRMLAEMGEVAVKYRSWQDKTLMFKEFDMILGRGKIQTKPKLESISGLVEMMVGLSEEESTEGVDWALGMVRYEDPAAAASLESYVPELKDELRLMWAWRLILLRLPANHLLYYKLVCKVWRTLISSPRFMSAHLEHSKSDSSNSCLLIHETQQPYSKKSLKTPCASVMFCLSNAVAVVGSVNGLLCVAQDIPGLDRIWIFNPVTGHIMKLPPVPSESESSDSYRTYTFAFVFWWDGEYKLAKIVSKPDNTTIASLWVSGSPETWSEIPVGFNGAFYNPPCAVSGCDAVIGDVAYWIVFQLIDGRDVGDFFVLSLDLKTLLLSLNKNPFPLHFMKPEALCKQLGSKDNAFPLPPDSSLLFTANWKGNFALVEKDVEKKVYNVWIMDDAADGGWSMVSSFAEPFPKKRCINITNGKSILLRDVGVNETGVNMLVFDVRTGECELVDCDRPSPFATSAHDFVGSFESIEGFKPQEAYEFVQVPSLEIFWSDPSPSKSSANYYLVPGYRKIESESEDESENESEYDY